MRLFFGIFDNFFVTVICCLWRLVLDICCLPTFTNNYNTSTFV